MDRLEPSDWVVGAGGLVLFIASFLPWYRWGGFSGIGISTGAGYGWLCFFFGLVAIVWMILRVAGVLDTVALPFPDGLVYLVVGGLGALIAILRLLFRPGAPGFTASPHVGIFFALAGAAAVIVGGVMKIREY